MIEKITNNKGNTLVELIMVMSLLLLFGVTIVTLISAGAKAQEGIIAEKNAQINARIALSYINVKLRQNDEENKISIENNAVNGASSILIKERGVDGDYDTWIFWSYDEMDTTKGKLKEYLVGVDEIPEEGNSLTIVEVDGFKTEINEANNSIKNTIAYSYNGKSKEISSLVYLRSK